MTWKMLAGGCREGTQDIVAVEQGSGVRIEAFPPSRNCITGGGSDPGAEDRWGRLFLGLVHQRQQRHSAVSGPLSDTVEGLHQHSPRMLESCLSFRCCTFFREGCAPGVCQHHMQRLTTDAAGSCRRMVQLRTPSPPFTSYRTTARTKQAPICICEQYLSTVGICYI